MKKILASLLVASSALFALSACDMAQDKATDSSTAATGGNVDVVKPSAKSSFSTAQQNAIGAAKDYLSGQSFSRKGLIQQLASKAGDGYGMRLATFAVNHIKVDWNKQAVQAAKDYLSGQHFSRAELIQQLSSSAGDGFTHAQALYAVNQVYR